MRRLLAVSVARYIAIGIMIAVLGVAALVAAGGAAAGSTGVSASGVSYALGVDCPGIAALPVLTARLAVDRAAATPGDTLSYATTVANVGARLIFRGRLSMQAPTSAEARVLAYYDEVDVFSFATHGWRPVAGMTAVAPGETLRRRPAESSGLVLAFGRPPSGVQIAASGDRVLGARVPAGDAASWRYRASIDLSPAQVRFLANARQTGRRLRNVLHVETAPAAGDLGVVDRAVLPNPFRPIRSDSDRHATYLPPSRPHRVRARRQAGSTRALRGAPGLRIARFGPTRARRLRGEDGPFRGACLHPTSGQEASGDYITAGPPAQTGEARGVSATLTPPFGPSVAFGANAYPLLASLAPGDAVTLVSTTGVPPVPARGESESEGDYLGRLKLVDGAQLEARVTAAGDTADRQPAPTVAPVSVGIPEHLPILTIAKTGPGQAIAGDAATYTIDLADVGGADAGRISLSDTAGDGSSTAVTGAPSGLAPGQRGQAHASQTLPAGPAKSTDTARVTWADVNGDPYGPVASSFTTAISARPPPVTPVKLVNSVDCTRVSVTPALGLTLAVDHPAGIPGDPLTYTATLTNQGAALGLAGTVSATAAGDTGATVQSYFDELDYFSPATQGWTPLVSAAAAQPGYAPLVAPGVPPGGLTLALTSTAAPGVRYPSSGDPVLGTQIAPAGTASWSYRASVALSPAQSIQLADAAQSGRLRNVFGVEVGLPSADTRQGFSDAPQLANPFQQDACSGDLGRPPATGGGLGLRRGGDASNASIQIATPGGPPAAFTPATTPALASLAPGASATVSSHFVVPVVSPKGAAESDGDYIARLHARDRAKLTANATATASASDGTALAAPPASASTTEGIAVLAITKTGPASAESGTDIDYELALQNSGSAQASSLAVADQAPDSSAVTVSDVPPTLDPTATATATATLTVPPSKPPGGLTDTASLSWKDANGNDYGPISSSATTTITAPPPAISPISTTTVRGNFYGADPAAQTFTAKPGDTPAFAQDFPTINFNPPAGTIAHSLARLPIVDPTTRPFTDITTDEAGNGNGVIVAQGNGQQAGVGPLHSFNAALTATFVVAKAGDVTFNVVHDDGFLLGIGGGATRVSGTYENAPATNATTFNQYPLQGAFNQTTTAGPKTDPVTVHFPKPGTYPYELDYFACCGQQLSLTLTVASFTQTSAPLSVYVGYADGLRPSGSIFPFPWDGSPGVSFVGAGTFDSGALRFHNNTDQAIPLDSVIVDIGGSHYDIWPRNLTAPPQQDLILAQTSSYNFDSSDINGTGCGQDSGLKPQIQVAIAGSVTTYADTAEVLNTHGYDSICQGNESASWQLVGGAATVVNTPLPPTASLTLSPAAQTTRNVGQEQAFTAAAIDAAGRPVPHLRVNLALFGANPQRLTAKTNTLGVATFPAIIGQTAGEDAAQATAFFQGRLTVSSTTPLVWNIPVPGGPPSGGTPGQAPPSITAVGPGNGTEVTKPVPVTASIAPPSGETIASWKVTTQAIGDKTVAVLSSGTGTPPSPLATFDPTQLPNAMYEITVSATATGGGTQTASSTVAVRGNLKLGRYTTTYQDLSVPVNGFKMQVSRVYDSIDKRVGDFGIGWHVEVSNFRVSTNRELGAGGWSEYGTNCFGALCLYAFRTSSPHYVTITFPDGHQEIFDFTPQGGSTLFSAATAAFTARAGTGTTSTLEGGAQLGLTATGDLVDGNGGPYNPERYRLTTAGGTVLELDVARGLVSAQDRHGNRITVDDSGVHASNGESLTFTRDGAGRVTQIKGPSGQQLGYAYSPSGDLTGATDAAGNAVSYSYDDRHHLVKTTGLGNSGAEQTLDYDAEGRVVAITDGNGHRTAIANDVAGRQQTVTDPTGQLTEVMTFDDQGDLLRQDAVGSGRTQTTRFTYDDLGRPLTKTDPIGQVTHAQYDALGDVTSLSTPRGTTTSSYGPRGEPLSITGPDGRSLGSFEYDSSGDLTKATRADGSVVSYGYDSQGHTTNLIDPAGHAYQLAYDGSGRIAQITDPLGRATKVITDPSGHISSVTDPNGATTSYTYSGDGNITSLTDPNGRTTTYTYNALGRELSRTDALGDTVTFSYDAAGHLAQTTDAAGQQRTLTYDPDGRVVRQSGPDGATTFTYDPFGHLIDERNPTAELKLTSDAGGRPTTIQSIPTDGSSLPTAQITYTYDDAGRVNAVTSPAGTTRYGYDGLSRLASLTDPTGDAFTLTYDALSKPVTLSRPNGVTDTLTYDAAGNLLRRVAALHGAPISDIRYTYDADGRRTSRTDSVDSATYTHDAGGRLIGVSHTAPAVPPEAYSYDAAGNRLTSAGLAPGVYAYDAANRLTSDGTSSYAYNADGRVIRKTNTATAASTTYEYDSDGELTTVQLADGTVTRYRYDPLGRRVERSGPDGITRTVYDGVNPIADFDVNNSLLASYASLNAPDALLETRSGGQRSYPLQDGQGSVTGVVDDAGHLRGAYNYDAFGNPSGNTPSGNRFLYNGRPFDQITGLYDYRAREYDPRTGRFLTRDPIASANPYPYVNNDPVDYSDPTGAFTVEYAALVNNLAPQQLSYGQGFSKLNRCLGSQLELGLAAALSGADTADPAHNPADEAAKAFQHLNPEAFGDPAMLIAKLASGDLGSTPSDRADTAANAGGTLSTTVALANAPNEAYALADKYAGRFDITMTGLSIIKEVQADSGPPSCE